MTASVSVDGGYYTKTCAPQPRVAAPDHGCFCCNAPKRNIWCHRSSPLTVPANCDQTSAIHCP
eukprot:605881-Pleurochrysis_carterae.AAC.2